MRDSLPLKLTAHWEANSSNDGISKELSCKTERVNYEDSALGTVLEESSSPMDRKGTGNHPEISQKLKESFLKAFKIMDGELRMQPSIDCFCSGTTAVALVKQVLSLLQFCYNIFVLIFYTSFLTYL